MNRPPDEWVLRHLPGRGSVPVRPGSPVDAALGVPDPAPRRTMELTLGYLGDLLWRRLPEAQPLLAELVVLEMDDAMAVGRELRPPTPLSIVSDVLWSPLLRRALEAHPRDRERLARYLAIVREAYVSEDSNKQVREALLIYVVDGLRSPEYLAIVEELDQDLFEIIRS